MSAKANESNVSMFDLGKDYVKSLDLLVDGVFKTVFLTISEFHPAGTIEREDGKKIDKPLLKFKETKKALVLSVTNQESLHLICGTNNAANIIGTRITLQTRLVRFGKDEILGLRIIPPVGTRMSKGLMGRLGMPAVWTGQLKNGKDAENKEGNQSDASKSTESTQADNVSTQ